MRVFSPVVGAQALLVPAGKSDHLQRSAVGRCRATPRCSRQHLRRTSGIGLRRHILVWGQRLLIENIDGHTCDRTRLEGFDQRCLVDNAVRFMSASSAGPTRPRVRLLNTRWIVTKSGLAKQVGLRDQRDARRLGARAVKFWLRAVTFMPKARPILATSVPMLPRPRTPCVLPASSRPTLVCQPPLRTALPSWTRLRALPSIIAHVNSVVGTDAYPVAVTAIPRSSAAAVSIAAFRGPV